MGRIIENCYPFTIAVVAALVYVSTPFLRGYILPESTPDLLAAVVSISGIAIGFIATAKSILISIDDKPIIKSIKKAGIFRRILRFMHVSILWSFWLCIWSIGGLFLSYNNLTEWGTGRVVYSAFWVFFAFASLLSYIRMARIWYEILDHIDFKT